MRPPLTLPRRLALKVLTGYDIPLDTARESVKTPGTLPIKGGRDTLMVIDAGNGRVTIQ
jgi:hypothetical protein